MLSCFSNTHHVHREHWETSMRNSPPFNKQPARQNKPPEHPVIKTTLRECSVLIFSVEGFKAPGLPSLGLFSIAQILEYLLSFFLKEAF